MKLGRYRMAYCADFLPIKKAFDEYVTVVGEAILKGASLGRDVIGIPQESKLFGGQIELLSTGGELGGYVLIVLHGDAPF